MSYQLFIHHYLSKFFSRLILSKFRTVTLKNVIQLKASFLFVE